MALAPVDNSGYGAAMQFTVVTQRVASEAEAVAEIESRGWHALTLDAPAENGEWHWHDFDSIVYVLEGSARIEFDDGTQAIACGPGVWIEARRDVVHREITDGYRAVFGLSVDPAQLTMPINKPVAELARR